MEGKEIKMREEKEYSEQIRLEVISKRRKK